MSTCQNCKATLGCSCQRRVASDGKPVCANCIMVYETSINNVPVQPTTTVLYTKSKTDNTVEK